MGGMQYRTRSKVYTTLSLYNKLYVDSLAVGTAKDMWCSWHVAQLADASTGYEKDLFFVMQSIQKLFARRKAFALCFGRGE